MEFIFFNYFLKIILECSFNSQLLDIFIENLFEGSVTLLNYVFTNVITAVAVSFPENFVMLP